MSTDARSAAGASTLAREYYCSTSIFAGELEQIFMRRWLLVGRASELGEPGATMLFELADESVIVVRGADDLIRGFYNVCRHRGARICTRAGSVGATIRCPYHAWTYGLDGRLLGAPNMAGVEGFDRANYPLVPVATAVWEGFVFVNFEPEPEPIDQAYGPLRERVAAWQLARLRVAARRTYELAANWKLIFENYAECNHCPIIHPRLEAITPSRDASNDFETGEILGGPMQIREGQETLSEDGRRCGPLLVSGPEREQVYYYTIFPGTFLALHPDYVLSYQLDPLAIDRTRMRCEWLFAPDYEQDPASDPEWAVAFWDRVNLEDQLVNELAQKGVRSRAYAPGPYSDLESQSAAFDQAYLAALGKS